MAGRGFEYRPRTLEARIGIINRNASFGGGDFPSRSVSLRQLMPMLSLSRLRPVKYSLLPEESARINYSSIDVVLFCRHSSVESLEIHRACKRFGIATIYDVDDLVTEYPSYFNLGDDKDAVLKRVQEHLAMADWITVENLNLRDSLPKRFIGKTSIRENSYSFEDYPLGKQIDCQSQKIVFTNAAGLKFNRFRSQFFRVLNNFCDRNDYEVHVFTDLDSSEFDIKNMIYRGATSWGEHKHFLVSECFDFAVIPLGGEEDGEISKFNSCKSIIKFIEYSAAGIPGIYSNVSPYKERLITNQNCILADNTEQSWAHALEAFLENRQLKHDISISAYNEVYSKHSMQNAAKQMMTLIDKLTNAKRDGLHTV